MHVIDESLSDHTIEVYAAILQAHTDFGESPSYVEIQHACRISAPTVRKAIRDLKAKGLITAPKFQARSIKPTDLSRTLSNREPSPWADLVPAKKYFKGA